MSRIGNKHIVIPAGVTVEVNGKVVTVKGPKGELTRTVDPLIDVKVENGSVVCTRPNDEKYTRSIHGTTRALINNMVKGCHENFEKVLEINGVGYRANMQGNKLVVNAGYSHPFELEVPQGLTVTCATPTEIHVVGVDRELVGQFAANVRIIRKPEPYKGKGIRYRGEYVRRKEGKKAK
jgi:large subunit ribosomal protein L6